MDTLPAIYIALIFSVLLSALFSGMEIAFLSANRLRLELDKQRPSLTNRIIQIYTDHPNQFIASILVGNNVAIVIYGMAMSALLTPWLNTFSRNELFQVSTQTVISTIIILLLAEFLPKALFKTSPNGFLKFFALPIFIFYVLFYPISRGATIFSSWLLRVFAHKKLDHNPGPIAFGKTDLNHLVDEVSTHTEQRDAQAHDGQVFRIFQNALEFNNLKVRDCYVPRTEIMTVDIEESVEALESRFITSNYSRIPVFEGSIDNIVGYVNAKSMFQGPESIRQVLRSITFVPETMKANALLGQFIRTAQNIAIVVDEFGGTAGLVTIEDLVEEILGEIDDEHDSSDITMQNTGSHEYLLSGRAEVDDVNAVFDLNIPVSESYETIAGFILEHHPTIPHKHDECVIGEFHFKILKVDANRITLVELKVEKERGSF